MVISPVKIWRRQKQLSKLIGKTGTIVSFSLVRVPPKDFMQQAPYPVVIVEFEKDERTIGQLVDWSEEDLQIGQKVVAVLRRVRTEDHEDIIPYTIKFKPL